jgi:hydroxysqualene dehydroxylase
MDRVEDLGHLVTSGATSRVAVIGGGYAGLSAAVTLAERGHACTVYESARVLGGRARQIEYQDVTLDNGQHILSGAYSALLGLMKQVGSPVSALRRVPLTLEIANAFSLRAWPLPAPLHLAAGFLFARGLSLASRIEASRLMQALKHARYQVDPALTVAQLLHIHQQGEEICRLLWQPLTISALNTPTETASAQVLANVLRDTLAARRDASDLLLPQTDLTALFPAPAAQWIGTRGCSVISGVRVIEVTKNGGRFRLKTTTNPLSEVEYDAVILAVGPHQLDKMVLPSAAVPTLPFQYEPIYTIYLQYDQSVALKRPMLGVNERMSQWFFDRAALISQRGLVAGVISASGAHEALDHVALARHVHEDLTSIAGPLPLPRWHKIVAEKFATFACTPAAHAARPQPRTAVAGLYLAGDYVTSDYPGTLEAAARSGIAAAEAAVQHLAIAH